ncbi:MAG: Amidophosphoribosyltransferase [Sodalis sp.]|nr:MAG: Amidophosphoribosyltransferase [Sodalis sp.]
MHIAAKGKLFTWQCAENLRRHPRPFEYIYFARPDSFIDKISRFAGSWCAESVILMDDSIVRGTTSEQIVEMTH